MSNGETIEVEILDPEKPIVAYNPIRAGIKQMQEKYGKTVFSVATTKDMEATKEARAEVREVRYNVEKIRKALKAPALAYSKRIDDEAKEYTEAILAIEGPIDDLIKAEEHRKADEKTKREQEERERALRVQQAIDDISRTVVTAVALSAEAIDDLIVKLQGIEVTLEQFGDRAGEAEAARQQTMVKLREMRDTAAAREAEAQRLANERADLERRQAEQEKAQAEAKAKADAEEAARKVEYAAQQAALKAQQDAIDRQRRELEEAKAEAERAERERLAKVAADEKAARDKQEAEAQAKRDAEAKRLQDQVEAEVRAAREKEEARQAKAKKAAYTKLCKEGPGDDEIVRVLSEYFDVQPHHIFGWIAAFSLEEAKTA